MTMSSRYAQAGDSNAAGLEMLIDRYHARVVGFAYQVLGDAELAAQAAEAVFTQRPLPRDEIEVWTAAFATMRRFLARGFVVRPLVGLNDGWQADLLQGLAGLHPEDRALILLRYHEGLPLEAVAQAAGLSVAVAQHRIARARGQLIDRQADA